MIPINLGFITFIIVGIPFILLLLWYTIKGVRHFYKNGIQQTGFLLGTKYILAFLLVIFGVISIFKEYSSSYYHHKKMVLEKMVF